MVQLGGKTNSNSCVNIPVRKQVRNFPFSSMMMSLKKTIRNDTYFMGFIRQVFVFPETIHQIL